MTLLLFDIDGTLVRVNGGVHRTVTHAISIITGNDAIIGDTHRDIQCAHATGTRSVAVCTGRFSRFELSMHALDLLLDNLIDTPRVIDQVLGI